MWYSFWVFSVKNSKILQEDCLPKLYQIGNQGKNLDKMGICEPFCSV